MKKEEGRTLSLEEKDSASAFDRPTGLKTPKQIGLYRILERLGQGGMGTVFLAEQEKPIRRKVALKIIKLGMDTQEVVGRFESERQALALMNHRSIAQVYDAGATDDGRPYFVMEYVRGIPITDYCDKNRLRVRERLDIFKSVCLAIQHAHQKGIVHRDIKPSNVLVTEEDGKAVPKVIDFGVAKATSQRLTEKTVFTKHGVLIGTPEYMSPEQAEMTELDIDTTTDIYSLGVILYELLSGTLPFELERLRQAAFNEIQRIIREEEPPRLSTRISRLGDTSTEIAKKRRTDLTSLRRELQGDLEWITMKAMEKNRIRRYATASEFAADVEHYINREPVVARPPSVVYKMSRFISRHKLAVGFSAFLLVVLVAFGVVMTIQAGRIAREAAVAKQISDFLVGLFEVSDPTQTQGETITVREILDRGAEKIEQELSGNPKTKARLQNIMGNVYKTLALYDRAAIQLEQALELRKNQFGENHPLVAESFHDLAIVYTGQAKKDKEEVRALLERSLEIREKSLGPNHPDVAESLLSLARSYGSDGQRDRQEELIRRAVAIYENKFGVESLETAGALYELGFILGLQAKHEESDPLFQRVLEIREKKLGPNHSDVAKVLGFISSAYKRRGEYADAEAIEKRIVEINEKVYGADHPVFAGSLSALAWFYAEQGKHDLADEYFERSIAIEEKSLGPNHLDIAASLNNFAFLYKTLYMYDKSEGYYKRAIVIREKAKGPDDPALVNSLNSLADLYQMQEKYDQAESLYSRGLTIREKALGPDHREVASSLGGLASIFWAKKEYARAEPLLTRQLEILEKQPGADGTSYRPTRELGYALGSFSSFYYEQRKFPRADEMLRRSLSLLDQALGKGRMTLVDFLCRNRARYHESLDQLDVTERIYKLGLDFFEESGGAEDKRLGMNLYYYGEFLSDQKRWSEAESILQRAHKILEADDRYMGLVLFGLAYLNREQERYDEAGPLYQKAIRVLEENQGPNHVDTVKAKKEYAELLHKTGRSAEAEEIEVQLKSRKDKKE